MTDKSIVSVPASMRAVCANETSRYAICGVAVLPPRPGVEDRAWFAATNGRIAVIARGDVQHLGDSGGVRIVPAELLTHSNSPDEIEIDGSECKNRVRGMFRDCVDGRFLPMATVLPEITAENLASGEYHAVRLDASLMAHLAMAVSDDGAVTLFLPRSISKAVVMLGATANRRAAGVLRTANPVLAHPHCNDPSEVFEMDRARYEEIRCEYLAAEAAAKPEPQASQP